MSHYDTLGDATRRAAYDATGQDDPAEDPDTVAKSYMLDMFRRAIAEVEGNLIEFCREKLDEAAIEARRRSLKASVEIKRLTKHREKIKAKDGINLMHAMIDKQIEQHELEVLAFDTAEKHLRRSLDLLDNYEFIDLQPFMKDPLMIRRPMFLGIDWGNDERAGKWSGS